MENPLLKGGIFKVPLFGKEELLSVPLFEKEGLGKIFILFCVSLRHVGFMVLSFVIQ